MNETDELRARIVRLELEIANRQAAPPPAPVKARGGPFLNFIGSLILIGLCIFGMWAALVVYFPGFAGTQQTAYSTPAALPTAIVAPNGAAARTDTYTRIVEATFPAPVPEDGIGDSGLGIREAGNSDATWTPWPADDAATAQAATDVAGNMTATTEQQGAIDRWVNGPPSTPTPTDYASFVQSFATPEPCSQFIGRVGAARAACATPEPEE